MSLYRRIVLCLAVFACVSSGSFAEPLDSANVNAFDRGLMFPYSRGLDVASDVTQYAAFLMPAIFLLAAPAEDYPEVGLMYAGSSALALGARFGMKAAFERDRPYMYFDASSLGADQIEDSRKSFPSGHTIMAFSGAAFTATMFALRYPDSPYRLPATIASFALAGSTAVMRVASGSHFTSDVIAGAFIGAATGFLVPFIATKLDAFGDGNRSQIVASPVGIAYRYEY